MPRWVKEKKLWLALAVLGTGCLSLFFLWRNDLLYQSLFHLQNLLTEGSRLRDAFLEYGLLAPLFFMGLQVLQVVFAPLPGEATGILGGYLFGAWYGSLYSTIGLTAGSWVAFGMGRLAGDFVMARLEHSRTYSRFNHLVCKGDFVIPFILFLIPGFPKDLLSYLLGLSRMPLGVFLFITTIGRIPGTIMLSLQGAHVYRQNYEQFAILALLTFVIFLPCYLFRKNMLRWLNHRGTEPLPETEKDIQAIEEK